MSEIDTANNSYDYYDSHYGDICAIREQNGEISDQIRAKKEVDLAVNAVGNLKPGDNVLDCPCGLGFQARELAKRNLHVTAIDGSFSNIEHAKKVKSEKPINFKTGLFENITTLEAKDSYNASFCFKESFGYEPTVEKNIVHLQSMFDVIKQGGKLVLTWPFTPSRYGKNLQKVTEKGRSPVREGVDKEGKRVSTFTVFEPPTLEDQIIPEKYIPGSGFDKLRGNSPEAIEARTVRSFAKHSSIFVDSNRVQVNSAPLELREYFKPTLENTPSDTNVKIGETATYYDIPLIRALCEYVGFIDVKCVPAQYLDGIKYIAAIVATKPSVKDLGKETEITHERIGNIL